MGADTKPFRVGISGSYGGLNLGDEAILQAVVKQLRDSLPVDIVVFSRDAKDTLARHAVDRAVPVRDLSRDEVRPEVRSLDLLILGGGGILYDAEAALYLREVELAQEYEVPVLVYAVSAGPLNDANAQALVRQALDRAAAVTVRDRRARTLLEQIGVRGLIEITADPALLLEPEPLPDDSLKREGLDLSHRLIGVSVREPGVAAPDLDVRHYHALLANAADYMVDRLDADLVFVPMERKVQDTQHSHAVVSQMSHAPRATVLKGEYTSGQMLSLSRVPFVALPYSSKVMGFLDDLEMESPPLTEVNAGRLIAHIDRCWDLREMLQVRLDRGLPGLKDRARGTNEIAVDLLTKRHQGTPGHRAAEEATG